MSLKPMFAAIMTVGMIFGSSGKAAAQSFEDTVSFIFTGAKNANSIRWIVTGNVVATTALSDFNQKECTVTIDQTVDGELLSRGKLRLKNMTGARFQRLMKTTWNPQPYSATFLEITAVGRIFDGPNRITRDDPRQENCNDVCRLTIPHVTDGARLIAAFQHLWTEYCPRRPNERF